MMPLTTMQNWVISFNVKELKMKLLKRQLRRIIREAHAKGVSKESIAGVARDAARDFDV